MPGLAGIITKGPKEKAEDELRRMVSAMRHEPFYVTGTWKDAEQGVYVGWIELEDPGRGPMPQTNETGDKVLVFSGSDFPEPGAADLLRERGHQVEEGSLAHLVHTAEEDRSFPAGLNGQFHGLLVDRTRGTAMLFNDRYAARRLYVHEAKDAFYFAAEAKALLAVRPELRSACARGLGEMVSCGCVLEDRTLFKGIDILPWGAAWTFHNGALKEKASYFSLREWEEQSELAGEPYYQALRDALIGNLPRYFHGADRIGMSLTGGLDTRVIMAWHAAPPGTLPCYTFGSGYRECRDVQIARRIARECGQPYHVIPVAQEFLSNFPKYAERTVFVTDGAAGVLHSPGLYANGKAREIAPVRMTGNFGDEMMRHWVVFRPHPPAEGVFSADFHREMTAAAQTYAGTIGEMKPAQAAARQISWFFHGLQALEGSQVEMRTPFLDNQAIRTAFRFRGTVNPTNDLRVRLIQEGSARMARIRTDLGYAGRGGKPATAFWYLFHRATMRAEFAFEHGDPRWLTWIDRRLLGRQLEKHFVGLHKFTHFSRWYRQELAGTVREILLDRRTLTRPFLNPRAVELVVEEHLKGVANHTPTIHLLLTLEYFHRLFVDAT
ncbi:MAG TPA: asparagine synthase-related protein [Terracidiphilus sp.]|nr:asparagine synthase-related protein [Terracidiphilus sp.]